MDKIHMAFGKRVDDMTHEEAKAALKAAIHTLEEERRYKHLEINSDEIRNGERYSWNEELRSHTYDPVEPTQNPDPWLEDMKNQCTKASGNELMHEILEDLSTKTRDD